MSLNSEYVTYRRSEPMTPGEHVCGAGASGVKHWGETPPGPGPAGGHSLSDDRPLPSSTLSSSWMKPTVPSPGCRGSPGPPQRDCSSGGADTWIGTHGRVQVKPPFVDRLTQTPLVSSVRLKLIWA